MSRCRLLLLVTATMIPAMCVAQLPQCGSEVHCYQLLKKIEGMTPYERQAAASRFEKLTASAEEFMSLTRELVDLAETKSAADEFDFPGQSLVELEKINSALKEIGSSLELATGCAAGSGRVFLDAAGGDLTQFGHGRLPFNCLVEAKHAADDPSYRLSPQATKWIKDFEKAHVKTKPVRVRR